MHIPAPSCLIGQIRTFTFFAAEKPSVTPDLAAKAPTADEVIVAKLRNRRLPVVTVAGLPDGDPQFAYFIPDLERHEAKSISAEIGGRSFVFGRIRDRGDVILEYHNRHERRTEPPADGNPRPAPSADFLSMRYASFRIDIPLKTLAEAIETARRTAPKHSKGTSGFQKWRWPDFKARAALVRNLDFVLSRPDIAVSPLPGGNARSSGGEVLTYGEIRTLGAFARYNIGRLGVCGKCNNHLVASDGVSRFCPVCGWRAPAFVYTGGGGVYSRMGAHIRFGKSVREAIANAPVVAPVPDAASRMLPDGLGMAGIERVFGGRLRDAYVALAMDEIAEHDDGKPRKASPFPRGVRIGRARELLTRAAPFVLARPDIAAAPLPPGVGHGGTFGDFARTACPDLPVLPGDEQTLLGEFRPADLENVFQGRLVEAYIRIALEELDALDTAAASAIRDGRSFNATFRLRSPDGSVREAIFGNVGGWAMLYGEKSDRPTGGVRVWWDGISGLAPTLRQAIEEFCK